MARDVAPIRVTGKYGSQVLKNVLGFKERSVDAGLIRAEFNGIVNQARETIKGVTASHPLSFLLFKEIPWWWNGFVIAESSQVAVRSPFLDNDLIEVLYQAPQQLPKKFGEKFEIDKIGKHLPDLLKLPTTGSYGGNVPVINKFVKKGIWFLITLDKLLLREKLPFKMTDKVGQLDAMLTKMHLNKIYSGYHDFRRYRSWYRDELSEFIKDTLLSSKTLSRPYWDGDRLKRIVIDHTKGRKVFYREIRKVLQIEMIQRVLIEGQS
jgi:asparagine synthase (glutamine-hydrolysing)